MIDDAEKVQCRTNQFVSTKCTVLCMSQRNIKTILSCLFMKFRKFALSNSNPVCVVCEQFEHLWHLFTAVLVVSNGLVSRFLDRRNRRHMWHVCLHWQAIEAHTDQVSEGGANGRLSGPWRLGCMRCRTFQSRTAMSCLLNRVHLSHSNKGYTA